MPSRNSMSRKESLYLSGTSCSGVLIRSCIATRPAPGFDRQAPQARGRQGGTEGEELGGHSLRAGCVTQAAMNGVREFVIMRQTGHKTIATLRRYIGRRIFRENAAAGLGI